MVRTFLMAIVIWGLLLSVCLGYSGGSGMPEDPYRIATKADLLQMAGTTAHYSKCFILTEDIDMEGQVFTDAIIAKDTSSEDGYQGPAFPGSLDGNGHKITNFTINTGIVHFIGLFGKIDTGGSVKNIGLENFAITSSGPCVAGLAALNWGSIENCYSTGSVNGHSGIGGLVGISYYGNISKCYSTGSVSGSSNFVGGLVAEGVYGSISNCYSTGNISGYKLVGGLVGGDDSSVSNCYSTGSVNGYENVGGLMGAEHGIVSNCYSSGSVSGSSLVGGLVGYSTSSIGDCYSTGEVIGGGSYVGGLVGGNYGGSVTGSFWDIETSGRTTSAGGEGKTTAEMQTLLTFTSPPASWDFTNETANGTNDYWRMCIDGVNYPLLWWQFNTADFTCPDGVNFIDFAILANAWLSYPMQLNWNERCDISEPPDNVIDTLDLAIFTQHWLEGL